MKKINILLFSVRELWLNRALLSLSLLLLTSILTAAFFLMMAAENIMPMFYSYANTLSPLENGFSIQLQGLEYAAIHLADDPHIGSIYVQCEDVNSKHLFYNGICLENYSGTTFDTNDETKHPVISGVEISTVGNNSTYIWVSDTLCEDLGCGVNDIVVLDAGYGKRCDYSIAGIFSSEIEHCDFYLSFPMYYNTEICAGYAVDHTIHAVLPDASQYYQVIRTMSEHGITVFSELEEEFRTLQLIDVMLHIFFFITFIAALITFLNLFRILFQNRLIYMMRLRMLGATTNSVLLIYGVMLEILMIIAFGLSYGACTCFSVYVQNLIGQFFSDTECQINNCGIAVLTGFLISTVLLVLIMLGFRKIVNRTDLINVLERKDGSA